jgi:DNA relaxase NicK
LIDDSATEHHVLEDWLRQQVGPAYDALKADPSRAVTANQVLAQLTAEHQSGSR